MKAVLFDFDGVLVNSEPLHYRALRAALLTAAVDISEDEYAAYYLAYDDWRATRLALERHGAAAGADRVEALVARKTAEFDALLASVPLYPGARELVESLAAEVPVAIASGAQRPEIERILDGARLRASFTAIVGAGDVARGKPNPDPYLAAMVRLQPRVPGLTAGDCVVIEDTMAGIASGLAAGMKVVGVAQTYPAEKLQSAHLVVPSVRELDPSRLRGLFS